ncbi:MAG: FAD-binding oxidoreductase [Proteobacteria bacterium]|nr:FAD-binding oxidoreductase [Pseudomonadota bacterium]
MSYDQDLVHTELVKATGKDRVFTDEAALRKYSQDQSFTPLCLPQFLVMPVTREEIQKVVRIANRHLIPIVPYSSGKNMFGAAVPARGGIVLSLEKMKKVLKVNTQEWNAIVEAGVTYRELQDELDKVGFRVATPFFAFPSASVVSTIIQRNHPSTATDFNYGNELIFGYELVLPDGTYFNVGKQAAGGPGRYVGQPTGPGLNFWRLFQGACGTLGIITSMALKIMKKASVRKVHFFGCKDSGEAIAVIRATQRKELGLECFALNAFNLASLLLSDTPEEKEKLKAGTYVGINGAGKWNTSQRKEFKDLLKKLPPWTVIIISEGFDRRAEEKIAYEEEDLRDASVREAGISPEKTVGGLNGLAEIILADTLKPQQMQKRYGFKGTIHPLSFYSPNTRVAKFDAIIRESSRNSHYPEKEIGGFLLPIERGRAIFCQFDLHCDPDDTSGRAHFQEFYRSLSESLISGGAFFDPPCGIWAEMMYRKAGTYTEYLKKLKKELDPQGIMNPGKLCF